MDVTAGGWDSTNPSPSNASLLTSNQSHSMQNNNPNNAGNDGISAPQTAVGSSSPSMSWGITSSTGVTSTSGAQLEYTSGSLTSGVSQPGAFNNAMSAWQGVGYPNKSQAAVSNSGWGCQSDGPIDSQSILSSLVVGKSEEEKQTPGLQGTKGSSSSLDQWGADLGSDTSQQSKPGSSGWGSPIPSPNPHAGTEAWGQPDPAKATSNSSTSWGQNTATSSAWGQSETTTSSTGWGDTPVEVETRINPSPNAIAEEKPAAWNQNDQRTSSSSSWGNTPEEKSSMPWGQPDQNRAPSWNQSDAGKIGGSPWDSSAENKTQWGGGGAVNPASQWGGSSNLSSGVNNTNANQPHGAWGSGSPFVKSSQSSSPDQFSPSTWAQAAGKGLPPKPPTPPGPPKEEDVMTKALTSHEGWGKMPVRQDTSWDCDEQSAEGQRKNSGAASSGSSDDGKESNHWNANNDGTAIWEATKSSAAANVPNPQQSNTSGASSGNSDWASDNDSGTWNGPPGSNPRQSSNSWSDAPPSNNQWMNSNPSSTGSSWAAGDRNNVGKSWGGGGGPNQAGMANNWSDRPGPETQWGNRQQQQQQQPWNNENRPGSQWANENRPTNQWGGNNAQTSQWSQDGRPPPPSQWSGNSAGGGAGNQWGNEKPPAGQWGNDGRSTNQWNPDTRPQSQWGGNENKPQWAGGNNPAAEWTGNQPGKDDNVWDKNGTCMWGDNNKPLQVPQGGGGGGGDNGHWGGGSGSGKSSSTSSWGDANEIEPTGWGDGSEQPGQPNQRRSSDVDDGTQAWGDPSSHINKPSNWGEGPPPGQGRPVGQPITGRPDKPWTQPPQGQMKPGAWGDGPGPRDDVSGLWGNQQQMNANKPGSWGDNQWNPAGARPKAPGWGGEPTEQWNKKQDTNFGHWGEETGAGKDIFESGEVGNWEGSQESGSSWSSARSWTRNNKNFKTTSFGPTGKQQQPQMRAKMLQQLMDMGFKKEDAQNALIRNDMDLEHAIADLVANAAKKRAENDPHFDDHRRKDLDGNDPAHFLQSGMPSGYPSSQPPVVPNHMNQGPGMQNSSGLSMNNQAQKFLQHHMTQQPPSMVHQGGQPRQVNPAQMQQQLVQRQLVAQLKVAVQAGLISPQLLTQQLTPTMLVMLQQLLQLQSVLQRLVAQQNQVFQQKSLQPAAYKQQLDQLTHMIQKIKEQIHQQQQAINQAQMHLPKQTNANKEMLKDLPGSISGLGLSNTHPSNPMPQQQQQQQQQSQQSRLAQWKLPSPDQKTPSPGELSRAVGSKPLQQSRSTPDLQSPGVSGLSLNDSTWSNTSSAGQDWPTSSVPIFGADGDGKDDLHSNIATSVDSQASTGSTSSNSSNNSSSIADMIEEFVPGKPWQGNTKSVEDDPFITPGSVSRSLSVNTIRDDYLTSTLGKSISSPMSGDTSSTWSNYGIGAIGSKPSNGSQAGSKSSSWSTSGAGEMGDMGWSGKNTRPPPGLANRSMSMPGGGEGQFTDNDGREAGKNSLWSSGSSSNSVMLKNYSPQVSSGEGYFSAWR